MAKIFATWDAPNYLYIRDYLVTLTQGLTEVDSQVIPFGTNRYESIDIIGGLTYTVTVVLRNTAGLLSAPVSVTLVADEDSVAVHAFTIPTLVNIKEMYNWSTGEKYWVTAMGDPWNSNFPLAMNNYTDKIFNYHSPGTSTITTEILDAGAVYTTDWTGGMTVVAVNGTPQKYIETRITNTGGFTRNAGTSFTGTGRFGRLSRQTSSNDTQKVTDLGTLVVSAP